MFLLNSSRYNTSEGIVLEQCSNVFTLTFFKLCKGCQLLHAMSRWLAWISSGWGVGYLLTQPKSVTLLAWLLHFSGWLPCWALLCSTRSVEWGGGSRHCCLLNSTHCFLTSLGSKVCAIGHQTLLPISVPLSPPQFSQSAPKSATTMNWVSKSYLVTWAPKSIQIHLLTARSSSSIGPTLGAKVCHQLLVLAQYQS